MKYFLFLLSLSITLGFKAQWVTQTDVNTDVASSVTDDMKSIGTASGKTVVVFWKAVSAPTNYELRMQVLNNQGVKQLGPDGVLVSNTMSMSTSTAIMKLAVDQNENVYIGATGTSGGIGYAFKLNILGVHQWNPNGINLGGGYVVTILPLSTGEAVVAWNASNQTLLQKYSSTGVPVWSTNQQVSNGATNGKSPADLFELSNNNFLLVFHVLSFGINSNLWAQKYNTNGAPLWTNPIQLSNKGTAYNAIYSSAQDGDVVYYGYKGSTGTHFDSYLQRINPDGTLPWGINGKDFDVTTINNEMDTKIAFATGGSSVWSICNYTNSSQSTYGVYIQKFDKLTGARQLGDSAKVIYPIGSWNVNAADLLLINNLPVFLMKSGLDNGASPTSLHACMLDANGNFAWAFQTKPMATYIASKKRIAFTKNSNGKVVASFIETKANGLSQIYAHSVGVNSNTGTAVVTACGSYTWINNITYTSSTNSPTVVLTNSNGGDSTVTLNLTITPVLNDTTLIQACGSYSWNGTTYTNSGIYQGATVNCTTSFLNLLITPSTVHNLSVTACGSYTWNGITYNNSGIYTGPTLNCVTEILDLTITPSLADTTFISTCDEYSWNGTLYTSSGIYAGPTTNCITEYLNLTITPSTNDTTHVIACNNYTWNGNLLSNSGIYIGQTNNCQTEILNLTIQTLDLGINYTNQTLSVNQTGPGITYQWIDCGANNSPIAGATSQSFSPSANGSYAVIVTQGACNETSDCFTVSGLSIHQLDADLFQLYPNPTTGLLNVQFFDHSNHTYEIQDISGRKIASGLLIKNIQIIDLQNFQSGIYWLVIDRGDVRLKIQRN